MDGFDSTHKILFEVHIYIYIYIYIYICVCVCVCVCVCARAPKFTLPLPISVLMEVRLVAVYLKRVAVDRNVDLITCSFYAENA